MAEVAAIATAVTALIGLGIRIFNSFKVSQDAKRIEYGRTLERRIMEAKTNEERAELVRLLDAHNSK